MARKSRRARPRSRITYLSPRGTFKSSAGSDDRGAPPSASDTIYFERGSAIPHRKDLVVLRRHARRLSERPGSVLLIRGFSNRRRVDDKATRLAESRAAVVRMLLLAMGVKDSQLDTSVGGVYPVTAATTRASRARSRRVTLRGPYVEVGASLLPQAPRRNARSSSPRAIASR